MAGSPSENERIFREWMRNQFDGNGMRKYSDNAIVSYCYSLKNVCSKLNPPVQGASNLFEVNDKDEFVRLHQQIICHSDFEKVNQESDGSFGLSLRVYQTFLVQGTSAPAVSGLDATLYLNSGSSISSYNENRGNEISYKEIAMKPLQRVYYGAPGTGKSHSVSMLLQSVYPEEKDRKIHCKRLIFHPTYTYDDFVGCIKPIMSIDKPLDYIYTPGPFTTLLKEAFLHPTQKYFLVIEEINRGNTPAIFGDIFQLLDRAPDGRSAYSIQNIDVTNFFTRDPGLKKLFEEGKIWLPPNFNIIATMNTADENIFVLDSAFKRRFEMTYVKIDFANVPEKWTREYKTFAGERDLLEIFIGSPIEDFVRRLDALGQLKRNWATFAMLANHIIDRINMDIIVHERRDIPRIAENKKLGPFFISDEELMDRAKFINKVVFYLKQDVFGESNHYMLISFEEIYIRYVDKERDIFELLV